MKNLIFALLILYSFNGISQTNQDTIKVDLGKAKLILVGPELKNNFNINKEKAGKISELKTISERGKEIEFYTATQEYVCYKKDSSSLNVDIIYSLPDLNSNSKEVKDYKDVTLITDVYKVLDGKLYKISLFNKTLKNSYTINKLDSINNGYKKFLDSRVRKKYAYSDKSNTEQELWLDNLFVSAISGSVQSKDYIMNYNQFYKGEIGAETLENLHRYQKLISGYKL